MSEPTFKKNSTFNVITFRSDSCDEQAPQIIKDKDSIKEMNFLYHTYTLLTFNNTD